MVAHPRNILVFMVLVGGALFTWLAARVAVEPTTEEPAPGESSRGYYLIDTVMQATDESGRIVYRILADRVEQRGEGQDFEIDRMRVEYTDGAGVNWTITAGRGTSDAVRETLWLEDDVRGVYADEDGDEAYFETSHLRLDAGGYLVSTDKPVTMVTDNTEFSATGLAVDLRTDEWVLRSDVAARTIR